MRVRFAVALLAATAVAPFAAQAQYYHDPGYTQEDAAAGAIVGGTVGAASDAATAIFAPPPPPVVTYVERERVPSIAVQDEVVVGRLLPPTVVLHQVPKYKYEYAVVNHKRVNVEPGMRRVVKIIE